MIAEKLVNGYLITVDDGAEAEELYDASVLSVNITSIFRLMVVEEVSTTPASTIMEVSIGRRETWRQKPLAVERFQPLDNFER